MRVSLLLLVGISLSLAVSLDAFLDFPSFASLETDGAGEAAVWVECSRQEGCNVHHSLQGQLTHFAPDDGVFAIDQVQAVHENRYVFVRCPQDGANPQGLLLPPTCAVWSLDVGSPEKMLLANVGGYVYAGRNMLFVMEGRLLVSYNLATSPPQKATVLQLQDDQGTISSMDLRSDGAIAFINDRGDRQIAGYIAPGADRIVWLDLTLGGIKFSPGNTSLVAFRKMFVNTDAAANPISYDVHVIVCNVVAGGECNVRASFLKMPSTECCANGKRLMDFVASDLLVVPIVGPEGFDPYEHVALVNTTSGSVTDLFAGQKCDVLSYQVNAGSILASHNCYSNTTETRGITRHTYPFDTVETIEPGIYGQLAGLANERQYGAVQLGSNVAFFLSTYKTHFAVYLYQDGNVSLISRPPRPTPVPFTLPQPVTYQTDFLINAHLFMPDKSKFPGPYRAVIYTHGGPMRQVFPAVHPMWDYGWRYAMNQYLASTGTVVLSINYRMGVGYGTKFQYCAKCGKYGAAEFDDVKAGAQWLLKQSFVAGPKVGIYGLSYGGLNAVQAATRAPELFDACVGNAPVVNWVGESRADGEYLTLNQQKNNQMSQYWPPENLATPQWEQHVADNTKLFYESSPMAYFSVNSAPLLLIQGDSDRDVAIQATLDLYNQARLIGANVESLFFPNQMHGLSLYSSQSEAAQATVDFLLKK